MYRLLIADDEQIVLDSMKFIIEKNFEDVMIAGTARSGREAIEKAEELRPDIILMDIKMPGINGIDAISEIKSRYPNTYFIIISAYEQFDFAKEAVKLGVAEYLVKPVNKQKLVETIRKVVDAIEVERKNRRKELDLKEKLESVLPILENGFIYSIVMFDDNKKDLENYRDIFEIEDGGYIMTVEFGKMERAGRVGNRIGMSVKSQSFYPYFRDVVKSRCSNCIVGPLMLNRIVVFFPCDFSEDEYTRRLGMINIANYLSEKICEKVDVDFCIGLGRSYKGIENLPQSYAESLKAIRCANGKEVVHIADVSVERSVSHEYPIMKERLLLEKASIGDEGASIDVFNFIYDWLVTEYGGSIEMIKSKLMELMVLIHRLAWDQEVNEWESLDRQSYLSEMMAINDIPTLRDWCRERIDYIVRSIKGIREKKVSKLVLKARNYIDINYNKEITLEDVSRYVNVSPHYFSRLFKDETGENFIEYLTSVRIQKAKELLKEGIFSVKEICYMVGYGDPNYFSRTFKKVVGITPTEYKVAVSK